MKINSELFNLIKQNKWEEFIKKCDDTIDYNIKDEQGNFLIQYIILYNKIDILEQLLKFNIKLDFIDNEGRTILYLCIKYNYLEIIKLLVTKTNNTIGIPIVNIVDIYNNYPIHYTIFFKNFEIFKYLIDICNIYVFDKQKNSLYHYLIKYKDINFFNTFILKKVNINIQNINYETPLISASIYNLTDFIISILDQTPNVNIKEKNNKSTALMIISYYGNIEIFNKILELKPDINIQNLSGDTSLHIAIKENNFEIIDLLILKDINFDLINIDGYTALHLILNQIKNNINIENYNIKKFLKKTNLNIQDNNGETCWHLIVQLKLYKKYSKILKRKYNNIYILNKNNKTPLDICIMKDQKKLLNIIVSSFLYIIKKKKKWIFKWQNKCSNNTYNDKKCLHLINNYIIKNKISIPLQKKKYNIDILLSKKKQYTFFTGITLDVITSYIYILKKYSFLQTSITTNFISNPEVNDYYKKIGLIRNLDGEFLNFEILWSYHKLILPTNLKNIINDFIENNKLVLAIPIGIELDIACHANLIIIDKRFKTIERFEPNGSEEPNDYHYNNIILDFSLKSYFENYFNDYEYLEPLDFLPVISLQSLESYESKNHKRIGDPGGFCVVWCVWYLEQRLKYIVHPKKLIAKLIINIKIKNISFKNLIRSFSNEILIIRDNILNELNIDINDIINNNINRSQILNINQLILDQIQSI